MRYSDLIPVKTRDLFDETSPRIFVTRGLINSYCLRRDKCAVQSVNEGQLQVAFSWNHQQLRKFGGEDNVS